MSQLFRPRVVFGWTRVKWFRFPVGYVLGWVMVLEDGRRVLHTERVYVLPRYRGRWGLHRQMLRAWCDLAMRIRVDVVVTRVLIRRQNVLSYVQHFGFRPYCYKGDFVWCYLE